MHRNVEEQRNERGYFSYVFNSSRIKCGLDLSYFVWKGEGEGEEFSTLLGSKTRSQLHSLGKDKTEIFIFILG